MYNIPLEMNNMLYTDATSGTGTAYHSGAGPGWLNELGSWITWQLIQAYYYMAWVRAWLCKLQKRCTRLAAASDKVYQLLAHGRWFSLGTPASFTIKTGRHDIAEILLKVALSTKNQSNQSTIPEHMSTFPYLSGVGVAQSL